MPPRAPPSKFGGGTACSACGKLVYATEQVKHNERIFHDVCFCCKLCSMRIVTGQATEHQGQLYHKTCLPKILKPPHLTPPVPASPSGPKGSPEAVRSPINRVESPSRGHPPSRPPPSPPGHDSRKAEGTLNSISIPPAAHASPASNHHHNSNALHSSPVTPTATPIISSPLSSAPFARSPSMRALEVGLAKSDDATKVLQNKLAETEALLAKETARCRELEAVRVVPAPQNTAQLDALRAENAKLTSALEEASLKLKQAQSHSEKLKQENQTLLSFHTKLEREHSALQQVADRLQSTLKEKTSDLQAQLVSKEEKIATLNADVKQRNAQVATLTSENQVLLGDLKLFEAEITSLAEKNHGLQQQLGAAMGGESPPALQPDTASADSQLLRELIQGHQFLSYHADLQHPDAKPKTEKVLVFYEPGPEGNKGWICWSGSGRRQVDPEHRVAVNPYTQLTSKHTRDAFRGSSASPNRCFSVLGADEDNALDLEADSEARATRWQEGIHFLLKRTREEINRALDDPIDFETLEQKQRMEELHKIEMELIHEVERLKVQKQALLEAAPQEIDEDSDTY